MGQHPFLESIRPVNLLSFGPNTEKIELRPLNVLIGPNGSGKSNLIEIIRLLHFLPDKDPWTAVLATGGVTEWIWKGPKGNSTQCQLNADFSLGDSLAKHPASIPRYFYLVIALEKFDSTYRVANEWIGYGYPGGRRNTFLSWLVRTGSLGEIRYGPSGTDIQSRFDLNLDRSVLSQLTSPSLQAAGAGQAIPELFEIGEFFGSLDFHTDWQFGVDLTARSPIPVGQPIERLEGNAHNLAQMLAYFHDYHRPVFERVNELMRQFYGPLKTVEIRIIGTHLQIAIEENGFSISAYRLSDGTLRWLALLAILLNPTPGPVTCLDDPELGLHPDIIPTLADLLRDASTRTQLILTTHSQALVECFSDDPEAVCVCEKVDGATQIQRLNKERLASWLQDYSLGQLWAKGEIGGNRW